MARQQNIAGKQTNQKTKKQTKNEKRNKQNVHYSDRYHTVRVVARVFLVPGCICRTFTEIDHFYPKLPGFWLIL